MNFNRILPRLCCGALGAFAIMFSAVSVSAYDFSAKTGNGTDIFYNINPDGKTVTVTYGGSKYNVSSLEIPQEVSHDGMTYTVTAIGYQAFERTGVRQIQLPNTITEIQTYAFNGCEVAEINFPTALKTIGEHAFYGTNISKGIFHEGLEEIGNWAFYGAAIDTLSLPKTLVAMGEMAFNRCKMKTVRIPGSLKIVSKEAFAECPNLWKVVIEEGVQSLGVRPYDGAVFSQSPLMEIEFPSSLTYIGPNTFSGNKFKEMVLPNTIKEIGTSCFTSCGELESITFSNGMEELPNYVCDNCPGLIKVTIPEGIKKIGINSFSGALLLSHLIFPETVTEVAPGALSRTGIVDFTFPKELTYISSRMFESCNNLTVMSIPENITEIKNNAFEGCRNLKEITLPLSLKIMENSVFAYCSNLIDVNIPASIGEVLPSSTFQDCTSLKKIVIPEGITKLDRYLFMGCSNLTDIELPKSLEHIGNRIIEGCDALRNLTIYHNVSVIEQHAFDGCQGIEEIHLYRAVLPETPIPLGWLVDRPVIPADNNCTLYVPVGSVESYKASEYWNTFKNIVGEEISEPLNYQISFPWSISGGKLTVNGEETKNVMEFAMDSDVEIVAVPNTGYHLQALLVNGEDVTAAMTDGRYIISKIASNYTVDAKFAENPVKLSLFMAVGGSVDVDVEKKDTFSCTITPEKGWEINTVTFNGRNVTAELTDDNRYTTPPLTGDSELRVTFENRDSAVKNIGIDATATKVYVDRDGVVMLEGLEPGVLINVYTVSGQFVNSANSTPGVTTMQLQQHGIYIIQTPVQTFKLQY